MPLTPEVKAERARQRMLATFAKYQTSTCLRKYVAPKFQEMIRAEFGADRRQYVTAVVDGSIHQVRREIGQCVCVTCGKVDWWNSGLGGIHTGHFIASRRNSIVLNELNVAPQCSYCNVYCSGQPQAFREWMIAVRGLETVESLQQLKTVSVSFTREELVDRLIGYKQRLKAAVESMANG